MVSSQAPTEQAWEGSHPTPASGGTAPQNPQLPKTSLKTPYLLTARAP